MTLVIDLPADLERALAARAAEIGIPVEEYAVRVLASSGNGAAKFSSGAEVVEYWKAQGLVGTKPSTTDPAAHARALREQAERRIR